MSDSPSVLVINEISSCSHHKSILNTETLFRKFSNLLLDVAFANNKLVVHG